MWSSKTASNANTWIASRFVPVDCFYEGENMLAIHPDECIDCGVCEPECPPKRSSPTRSRDWNTWLRINAEYAKIWPNITNKREPPADAKDFDGRAGKYDEFFSPKPGEGD